MSVPASSALSLSPSIENKFVDLVKDKLADVPAILPDSITSPVFPLEAVIFNPCKLILSLIEAVKLLAVTSIVEPDSTKISDELLSKILGEPLTNTKSTPPIVIS